MKKTTNYQLSQWDAGDRILREDFNQDNKKLDNAIAALRDASPVVKLLDFTARSSQSKMEISLADIDLSDYRELWIYPKFSASTTETNSIYLTVNDLTQYQTNSSSTRFGLVSLSTYSGSGNKTTSRITLLLGNVIAGYHATAYLNGSTFAANISGLRTVQLTGSELTKMAFCSDNGVIGSGTRVTILGVRI